MVVPNTDVFEELFLLFEWTVIEMSSGISKL